MKNLSLSQENVTFQAVSFDVMNHSAVHVLFYVIYSIIFIIGILGNVLVCFVVLRNRDMQTVTNLFIMNLAVSDILLNVLAVPFTPLYTFLQKWIFGSVICHLVPYAQGISIYLSTLTLTSIAIDRFRVIMYPFHPRMRVSTCGFIVAVIWALSIFATLPYGIFVKYEKWKDVQLDQEVYICEENWPSEKWRKIFSILTTKIQFLVPFVVMVFCYICISVKLRKSTRKNVFSRKMQKAAEHRNSRTTRMLTSMVFVFLISWLPLNVFNMLSDFNQKIIQWEYSHFTFFVVHAIAMSSTCYNPLLYAWLNENFRTEFKRVLPCFKTPNSLRNAMVRSDIFADNKSEHSGLFKNTYSQKSERSEECDSLAEHSSANIQECDARANTNNVEMMHADDYKWSSEKLSWKKH